MKNLKYVISKEGLIDIENIWYYTVEKWSVDQANRYYELIFDEIDYICRNPESGKTIDNIRNGYRVSKVKSHLIFYKIVNDTVEVVRILHHHMDIKNRLDE